MKLNDDGNWHTSEFDLRTLEARNVQGLSDHTFSNMAAITFNVSTL